MSFSANARELAIMGITNSNSRTRIDEVADGIYRISTPVPPSDFPGGFTFNQFLIDDEEPLLFHTGLRRLFPLVREAIATVLAPEYLRYVAFSHVEADECGSLNEFLAIAPEAVALCGVIAADVSVRDLSDRPPRDLTDAEQVSLGRHTVRWLYTPHMPHAWECGYLYEVTTRTLFCGDLFTQPGHEHVPITEADILESSEAMRAQMDYYSHSPETGALIEKLAATEPTTLACMHGASFRGDGGQQLRRLRRALNA
jgi:flavorubredoxin